MPYVVITVVLIATAAALWLGGRNVHKWDSGRDPRVFRDLTGHATIVSLRVGLLLLMTALAVVAVVGSLAAIVGDAPVPGGCYVAAVVAVLIAVLVVGTFGRAVSRTSARSR